VGGQPATLLLVPEGIGEGDCTKAAVAVRLFASHSGVRVAKVGRTTKLKGGGGEDLEAEQEKAEAA
jgi:hypothetical protein